LRVGALVGETVVDCAEVARAAALELDCASMRALLSEPASARERLWVECRAGGVDAYARPLDDVVLEAPVPDPEKIICLGLNYRDHAEEAGLQPPVEPIFFAKYPNSLCGHEADVVIPRVAPDQVDYEGELAVVIGRRAKAVSVEGALSHVAGVMPLNDVSARDLQLSNNLWITGKAIDTFAPCGPALVTLDEVDDIGNMAIRTRVNGELMQEGTTANLIFGVAETIAFLSRTITLVPGDIIATGTPAGVGATRQPPVFLHPGDTVEVEIEGVGTLRNGFVAEAG
jgi:2-keto-4-pentenoate hydratase/2-oxohepta-3-ene-1,7-dioic acid hydratase in catechol pathway